MGTRSYIGMERDDGSVAYIYCHWDGYPSHNGAVLMEHYSSAERMERLVALGDISSLRPKIEPDGPHGFTDSQDDVVIAYHRERGEEWDGVKPTDAVSIGAIPQSHGAEYVYIWRSPAGGDGGAYWMYAYRDCSDRKNPTWAWQPLTSDACKAEGGA